MRLKPQYLPLFGLVLTLALALNSPAQTKTGSIIGSAADADGHPLRSVVATARSVSTNATFKADTDGQGGFRFEGLPAGHYSVAIESEGFNRVLRPDVLVRAGSRTEVSARLQQAVSKEQLAVQVADLEQRLQQLESRNRELEDQNTTIIETLKELKAKLEAPPRVATAEATTATKADVNPLKIPTSVTPGASSSPSAPDSISTASTNTSTVYSQPTAAPPKTRKAPQDQDKDRWSMAIGENNKFHLYGQLRLDMIVDSQRPNNAQSPLFIPSPDPLAGGKPGAGSFTMHPRLTTFGIDYSGPQISALDDGQLSGKLEVDFQNGGAEFQPVIRILQAYLKMTWGDFWILGGQKWDTFSPIRPIVNDDSVMLAAGNVGIRRPQFLAGYEPKVGGGQFSFVGGIGLTGAVDSQDLDGNGFLDGQKSGRPNIQARAAYSHPLWVKDQSATIGLSGVYGFLNTDNPIAGRTSFREQLVNVDYVLPIASVLSLRGEGWWGHNLSDLVGGVGQGLNLLTGREIRSRGGWSELNIKLSKYYSFNPGFTIDDPVDVDIPNGGRTRNRTFYFGNRFIPSPNLLIGFDYLRWRTDFKGFQKGIDNRVNIFFAYHF